MKSILSNDSLSMTKSQTNNQKSKHAGNWYFWLLRFRYCKLFVICNLVIGIFAWSGTAKAETILLKSGQVVEGTIIARTDEYIKIDPGIGIPVTYYLDEIENAPAAPSAGTPSQPDVAMTPALEKMDTFPAPQPPAAPAPETKPQAIRTPSAGTPKETELYEQALNPPSPFRRLLDKNTYLKEQWRLSNQRVRQAVLAISADRVAALKRFLNAHPRIKELTSGEAGLPVVIGLLAGMYALVCLPFMLIARKLHLNGWMAWIPILQIFLLIRMAGKSLVWFLLFFLPVINLLAFLFAWMSIVRRLGQPRWFGYLMLVPGVNLLLLWYLALIPAPATPKRKDDIDTGIKFE